MVGLDIHQWINIPVKDRLELLKMSKSNIEKIDFNRPGYVLVTMTISFISSIPEQIIINIAKRRTI